MTCYPIGSNHAPARPTAVLRRAIRGRSLVLALIAIQWKLNKIVVIKSVRPEWNDFFRPVAGPRDNCPNSAIQ